MEQLINKKLKKNSKLNKDNQTSNSMFLLKMSMEINTIISTWFREMVRDKFLILFQNTAILLPIHKVNCIINV